jgi:beta-lactamase class A
MGCAALACALLLPLEAKQAPSAALNQQLQSAIAPYQGKLAFGAVNLKTGESAGFNDDVPVPTASTIKLPIMVEAFYQAQEGKLDWNRKIELKQEDKVPGSGLLQDLSDGDELPIRDVNLLMIVVSDNTAANDMMDVVGIANVNARMKSLGLKNTILYKKAFKKATGPLPADQPKFGLGKTTVSDMLHLLTLIQEHKILTPQACDEMLTILKKQRDIDAFPRYLDALNQPGQPPIEVAHKTGALDHLRADVGIIDTPAGPIAIAGYAYDEPTVLWTADNPGLLVLARMAKTVVAAKLGAGK